MLNLDLENDISASEAIEKLQKELSEYFAAGEYPEYLRTMAKFHKYSPANCLLIKKQCPKATHVATFWAWIRDFGRYVKKVRRLFAFWLREKDQIPFAKYVFLMFLKQKGSLFQKKILVN